MTPRSIDSYGGIFVDYFPVETPDGEQSADFGNRLHEDVAQGSRTSIKTIVFFPTSTGGAGAITPTSGRSQMGTGSGDLPTIAKVSTGRYTITYPSTFTDRLGAVENIVFIDADGAVASLTVIGHVQCTVATSIINVAITDMAGAASDLTNGTTIKIKGF